MKQAPSPPSDLTFSQVSDSSLTLTWTAPRTPINSFKVTYTHTLEGEHTHTHTPTHLHTYTHSGG